MVAAKGIMVAFCPEHVDSLGILMQWREIPKSLSNKNRTGMLKKKGPILRIHLDDLTLRMDKKSRHPKH